MHYFILFIVLIMSDSQALCKPPALNMFYSEHFVNQVTNIKTIYELVCH